MLVELAVRVRRAQVRLCPLNKFHAFDEANIDRPNNNMLKWSIHRNAEYARCLNGHCTPFMQRNSENPIN